MKKLGPTKKLGNFASFSRAKLAIPHYFCSNLRMTKLSLITTVALLSLLSLPLQAVENPHDFDMAKEKISDLISNANIIPAAIELQDKKYNIEYTMDEELSNHVIGMLKKLKPNYSAVVVVDNDTGNILTAIGYEKKHDRINYRLPFSSSHPAASLAKVVTSAVLLEQNDIDLETPMAFQGRSTTLKPRQLTDYVTYTKTRKGKKKVKVARRNKYQNFVQAFASSNNPIFGKAAMKNISGELLKDMADRMGFNQNIMEDLTLPASEFHLARSPMIIAQYASGYNNLNTISPIHAAIIPSIVVNDGYLKNPRIIKRIYTAEDELDLPEGNETQVLQNGVADDLKQMMEATITIGTGRRGFSAMNPALFEQLEIGGKSGTFSGGFPYGKREWFIAFAKPKDESQGKGISIAVMNINSKKKVRSSRMVREIVEYYFQDLQDGEPSPVKEEDDDGSDDETDA